jgi:hypothetical protein
MFYRTLVTLAPVFLVVLGGLFFVVIDYRQTAMMNDELTLGSYFSGLPGRFGTEEAAPMPDLSDMSPHGFLLWKDRPVAAGDFAKLRGGAAADAENGFRINTAMEAPGVVSHSRTIEKDAEMMMFAVQYRSTRFLELADEEQRALLANVTDDADQARPFAKIQGVTFTVSEDPDLPGVRRIMGQMGPQLDFELITNTTDRFASIVLGQLDLEAYNAFLENPIAEVDPETKVELIVPASAPEQDAVAEEAIVPAAPAEPAAAVVNRGVSGSNEADCTLQNGVRRCTVGSN